ncbi:MAG TPA: 2-amino-4-hydroxy-6-hydroxymethyldihydropteridine diphosphokinase [Cryobacterium sp.]|nr:2-amino-4-hydroxy-6-hydroxymethyldihydropteridine diphosphokinase [Cryobacterium sp.]
MSGQAGPAGASVVLALGSNLGDRAATLLDAARAIADLEGVDLSMVSHLYETAAVKPDGVDEDAPRYLNMVVTARYTGDPHALLDAVNAIEHEHGRVRAERWGDRTLDIDIIAFGDLELADERLVVPHPRAWQRDFVLAPWLELEPDAVIPGRGRVSDLLADSGNSARRYVGGGR